MVYGSLPRQMNVPSISMYLCGNRKKVGCRPRPILFMAVFLLLLSSQISSSSDCVERDSVVEQPLVDAAFWSITHQNTELLKAILCAGLPIDAPLDFAEVGDKGTALHWAVLFGHERVVRFLLANGASTNIRDQTYRRPIDVAVETGQTNLCALLARVPVNQDVDGIPEEILARIFHSVQIDTPVFLSLNGQDPSDKMLRFIAGYIHGNPRLLYPASKGMPVHDRPKARRMRHREIDEEGFYWDVRIVRNREGDFIYSDTFSGKTLLQFHLQYGYWMVVPDRIGIWEALRTEPKWKRDAAPTQEVEMEGILVCSVQNGIIQDSELWESFDAKNRKRSYGSIGVDSESLIAALKGIGVTVDELSTMQGLYVKLQGTLVKNSGSYNQLGKLNDIAFAGKLEPRNVKESEGR